MDKPARFPSCAQQNSSQNCNTPFIRNLTLDVVVLAWKAPSTLLIALNRTDAFVKKNHPTRLTEHQTDLIKKIGNRRLTMTWRRLWVPMF